jgi:hypothetical protein
MMMDDKSDFLESLEETSKIFNEAMKKIEDESEEFWNSFSKNDQLKLFCAVSRRISEGELKQKGSYRFVLYNTFGFDTSAYVQAQVAGYLEIHNAIFDRNRLNNEIKKYLIKFGEENTNLSKEDLENKINLYFKK